MQAHHPEPCSPSRHWRRRRWRVRSRCSQRTCQSWTRTWRRTRTPSRLRRRSGRGTPVSRRREVREGGETRGEQGVEGERRTHGEGREPGLALGCAGARDDGGQGLLLGVDLCGRLSAGERGQGGEGDDGGCEAEHLEGRGEGRWGRGVRVREEVRGSRGSQMLAGSVCATRDARIRGRCRTKLDLRIGSSRRNATGRVLEVSDGSARGVGTSLDRALVPSERGARVAGTRLAQRRVGAGAVQLGTTTTAWAGD